MHDTHTAKRTDHQSSSRCYVTIQRKARVRVNIVRDTQPVSMRPLCARVTGVASNHFIRHRSKCWHLKQMTRYIRKQTSKCGDCMHVCLGKHVLACMHTCVCKDTDTHTSEVCSEQRALHLEGSVRSVKLSIRYLFLCTK